MGRYYDNYYFPPSTPREVKGGIKAQTRRGEFAAKWWAKRWIAVLESFDIGARLDRGRSYARRGQVLSIDIEEGLVLAKVQGSRPSPYAVTIKMLTLSSKDWGAVAQALSTQALFRAKLLVGEMPEKIEDVFASVKLSLFPASVKEIHTDCSCPDWSNPCKHIAAVFYLLGEEFDRDPFLIFKLRGITREMFLRLLSKGSGPPESFSAEHTRPVKPKKAPPPVEPIPLDPLRFWGQAPEEIPLDVQVPPVHAALVKRLGSFPFWRGEEPFVEALEPIYAAASQAGLDLFMKEAEGQAHETTNHRLD